MQGSPVKPREAQRRPREPRELTEPKQSIDFTGVFATKVWARISFPSSLQKAFPTPRSDDIFLKKLENHVFNAMGRRTMHFIMILSTNFRLSVQRA